MYINVLYYKLFENFFKQINLFDQHLNLGRWHCQHLILFRLILIQIIPHLRSAYDLPTICLLYNRNITPSRKVYHNIMSPSDMKNMKKTDEIVYGPSLLPLEKAVAEESEMRGYQKRFLKLIIVQAPIIAWSIYFATTKILLSQSSLDIMNSKLEFIKKYELHYVYISVYMVYLARLILVTNVNGARGPTRLGRPDQHIYQVVGTKDLVLMATKGVHGRFNRAQRGILNMDEGLPLFAAGTLLVAPVFGQVVCFFLVPLYAYGRVKMAFDYKESKEVRLGGFMLAMIAEHGMFGFVGLIAIKVFF